MAIKYGYPAASRIKLLVRKTSCENELKKLIPDACEGRVDSLCKESGIMREKSRQIETPVYKFVMKEQNASKGKSLLATENISSGSLVLTEKPYLAVVHSNNLTKYCYHCLRKIRNLSQPFPCLTCNQVRFCSGICSTEAYSQYHRIECCYLSIFEISKDFHVAPKITLKALLKQGLCEALTVTDGSHEETDSYRGFMDLVEHPDKDLNDYTLAASIITAFLLEKHPSDVFTRSTISRLVERITKHFRQVNVNGITITGKEVTTNKDFEDQACYEETNIGCGIYLTARLINHSCDPNTRITKFDGNQLYLHAVRDIKAGEEITISYGGSYKWQLLSVRKKMLLESYFFDCCCSACEQKLQPTTKAIICGKCEGPVVSEKTMTCLQCGTSDDVDLKKIIDDTSACMKITSLASSLMDNSIPGAGETNYQLAIKTLKEARNSLSQIVYKTHDELWKIDQKLVVCCLKTKMFAEAVEHSKRVYDHLVLQYHPTYYQVFNSLLCLIDCQVRYYQDLKTRTPVDKNELNIVKSETHKNLDLVESIFKTIVSEDGDHAIRQRIVNTRKLLCLSS